MSKQSTSSTNITKNFFRKKNNQDVKNAEIEMTPLSATLYDASKQNQNKYFSWKGEKKAKIKNIYDSKSLKKFKLENAVLEIENNININGKLEEGEFKEEVTKSNLNNKTVYTGKINKSYNSQGYGETKSDGSYAKGHYENGYLEDPQGIYVNNIGNFEISYKGGFKKGKRFGNGTLTITNNHSKNSTSYSVYYYNDLLLTPFNHNGIIFSGIDGICDDRFKIIAEEFNKNKSAIDFGYVEFSYLEKKFELDIAKTQNKFKFLFIDFSTHTTALLTDGVNCLILDNGGLEKADLEKIINFAQNNNLTFRGNINIPILNNQNYSGFPSDGNCTLSAFTLGILVDEMIRNTSQSELEKLGPEEVCNTISRNKLNTPTTNTQNNVLG